MVRGIAKCLSSELYGVNCDHRIQFCWSECECMLKLVSVGDRLNWNERVYSPSRHVNPFWNLYFVYQKIVRIQEVQFKITSREGTELALNSCSNSKFEPGTWEIFSLVFKCLAIASAPVTKADHLVYQLSFWIPMRLKYWDLENKLFSQVLNISSSRFIPHRRSRFSLCLEPDKLPVSGWGPNRFQLNQPKLGWVEKKFIQWPNNWDYDYRIKYFILKSKNMFADLIFVKTKIGRNYLILGHLVYRDMLGSCG